MAHKNQDIEILRALAVLMTVTAHLFFLFPWRGGVIQMWGEAGPYVVFWTGVDLFFCISGYVISKSLIESIDSAKGASSQWVAVKSFWIRRAYRLLPSSWLWVAVFVAGSFLFNRSGAFDEHAKVIDSAVMAITNTANMGSFSIPISYGMGIYWSLSLEEQFYFAFPFFLILVPIAWRWKALLALIAIQFPLARGPFLIGIRLDSLMWGVLIYIFSRTSEYKLFQPTVMRSKGMSAFVTIGMFAGLIIIPGTLAKLPFNIGMVGILTAALVFCASFDKGYIFPFPSIRPIMTWIGARSYTIYLTHVPAFLATREIWYRICMARGLSAPDGTYTLRFSITALTLTLLLTEINYRLIESPLRRRGALVAKGFSNSHRQTSDVAVH